MSLHHLTSALVTFVGANPLLERLFFASLELIVLALAVMVIITCFRLRSPRVNAILWLIVLTKPIFTLVIGAPFPVFQVTPTEREGAPAVSAAVSSRGLTVYLDPAPPQAPLMWSQEHVPLPSVSMSPSTAPARSGPSATPAPVLDKTYQLPQVFLGAWLIGVFLLLGSTCLDRIRLYSFLRRTAAPPTSATTIMAGMAGEMALSFRPRMGVTTELESPAIVGWFRPVVVVPAWLVLEENATALSWALRHELTHLKHFDTGANFLRRVAQILFFFHPVTWWAGRRWEHAVELACDRAVVQTDDDVTAYAEQLYAILVQARQQRQRAMGTGLFATRTQINTRIAALLNTSLRTPARLGVAAALALTVFAGLAFAVGGTFLEGTRADETVLPARTLNFPADHSLGTVWIGEPQAYDYTPDNEPDMTVAGGWVKLGDAMGTIDIPEGKSVRLEVGPKGEAVDLSPLAALEPDGVQYLDLYKLEIGDDDLKHLSGLTALEALSLYRTKVTDAGLKHLTGLKNLRWLDIGSTDIEGDDLEPLTHLKKLVHLELNHVKLNKEAANPLDDVVDIAVKESKSPVLPTRSPVGQLAQIRSLRWLNLKATNLADKDLKSMAPLTELRTLILESCPITNEGLRYLAPFTKLSHLSLERTEISEGYKPLLAGLSDMKDLNLDYTSVEEAPHRMLVLGGRVVNEAGAAVPNVEVQFYGDYPESVSMSGDDDITDGQGRWEIRMSAGWTRLMTNLTHPDYISDRVLGIRPIPPKEQLLDKTATFVLAKGATFSGRVRDASGAPVAEALVLNSNLHGTLERMKEDPNTTLTDADGRFTMTNLEKRRHKELTVVTPDHAPVVVPLDYSEPGTPLEVTLQPGASLDGVITDGAGAPLGDARVSIREWRPNHQHSLPREVTTDEGGHFTLVHLPDHGTISIGAQKPGYYGASSQPSLPLSEPLQFAMVKRSNFEGKVVDAVSKEPVADYEVELGILKESGEYRWLSRFTDAEINRKTGAFSAEPVATFDATKKFGFVARIRAKGYRITESTPLEAARLGEEVTIALEPTPAVEGIVRDADGQLVEGARIAWVREDQHAFMSNGVIEPDFVYSPAWFEVSDSEGRFAFAADGTPGVLVVTHEKGLAWLDLHGHEGPITLDLKPWVRVVGTVAIAKGALMPVTCAFDAPTVAGRDDFFKFVNTTVNTDETGHFVMDYVPPMPLTIGVQRRWEPSHGVHLTPEPGEVLRVNIGDGMHTVSGTLDLLAIAGLVEGGNDELTDDRHLVARATAVGTNDPKLAVNFIPEIKPDGSFLIAGMPPGDYTLAVTAHATPPQNACGRGTPVGRGEVVFTVGGATELALGTVNVSPVTFPQENAMAPPVEGTVLGNGEAWTLASEQGKLVVLDFWATWCAPCVAAIPTLKEIVAKLPADRVSLVGLNLDMKTETAEAFMAEKELPWKQVYIGAWADDNLVTGAYGVSFIPSIWIIDVSGKVLARDVAPEELAEMVARFL